MLNACTQHWPQTNIEEIKGPLLQACIGQSYNVDNGLKMGVIVNGFTIYGPLELNNPTY